MNLTRLEEFVLTTNNKSQPLVFNVKDNWRPPFKLKILHLESCHIGSNFPKWLQVQSELTYVILKNVEIKGTIPEEWFSMISSNLTHLDLSNNQIKGNLPHQLVFPNVTKLFLQSNLFSGTIPSNISDLMPSLQYLDLSENHLCGKIPLSILKIKHLNILVLRRNNLSGELPHHWNESQMGLRVVDISHNNICGKILSSMGFLGNLSILVLSNNNLSGEIPSSLQNFSIVSMDFGGNRLSGNLPSWIESDIFMLRLRSNLFNGIIPKKWCNLYKLHILDIAQNNLSGDIPNCFNNFIALVDHNTSGYEPIENYTENANIVTKGREYEYDRTLQLVTCIDLSGNSLTGGIPIQITSLTRLGTLNLSMNHLKGSIPKNIGNMRWLETLDLSNNRLFGSIPRSFTLELSFNNLTGRIPSGSQLQTLIDATTYKGNPSLCGSPLPTKCLGDETSDGPSITSVDDKQGGGDYERIWFYASIGLGFGVGFWSVCGTLLLKKSWRHCYFRFCDDIKDRMALLIALRVVHLKMNISTGDVNSPFSRDVNASLSGKITCYIGNVSSLTHLDLEGNSNLSTKNFDWVSIYIHVNLKHLPSSLAFLNFTSLHVLDLSYNPFNTSIPQWLFNLTSLTNLDLTSSNQGGKILDSFVRLERLKYLYLGVNHFSGSIPASIGNLSSLKELDLSYNKMNGTIPESFGQLSKLVKLYLLENSWECVITEAQLMNLTRLEEFVLTTNNKSQPLVFNVKDNWRPPFKLKILHLESCLIGPKFTKWLQVQSELTYVILKNVEIKGTIPEEWFSMISSNLAHLDLSNNQIKGNLPHQLVFPNVTKLFLQSNLFSGTILSNISDLMPSLQYLDLSENHLCGKIPLSISKIKHLNILVLRRNNLLGELPHHWNESQMGLRVVDISHNNICGKILSSMGFLGNLSILVLSNNNLSGEIPSSLKNCSIVSMDFGGNHLSGNLPSWIESDIFMLRLRSNLFSGIISKKWCNLYKLHILDLAQNNLSGGIPDCFNNFIAMVDHNTSGYEPIENYTKKANIVTKGREYEYDRTLQQEKSLLVRAIFPRKNSNIVAKGY
ncbi:receptor-like protein eix2 [Quercus suber]|uniref:Receptor-like protein eix2 n=1 Tax=Quercus suber TaxID=58331 RepID=A0AAW0KEH2_QUESU